MEAKKKNTVVVVGGGAAGMMAAITAKSTFPENEVFLCEKNGYLGAKVLISGGGRCNVTTGIFDIKRLLENYPRGAKFLRTALYNFSPQKVMEWFEDHHVQLKIEEDLRVFPVSDNGKDVVSALERELKRLEVTVFLNSSALEIKRIIDSNVELGPSSKANFSQFEVTLKTGQKIMADKVILTTGGNAYRHTGSTGDGYYFAQKLGHSITALAASLNSFIVSEPFIKELAGVAFKKAKLTFKSATNQVYERFGPFLFTHFGVTGPAVFALSSMAAYEKYDRNQPAKLFINFFPEQKPEEFKSYWHDLAQKHGKKTFINFLDLLLPKSLCPVVTSVLQLDPFLQAARLNRQQIQSCLQLLQNFPLKIVGRGAGDEFVTAGGVELSEIDSISLQSKLCPGLFFAGEIMNVDGFTGGFNLQAAWATGFTAGKNLE